MRIAFIGQSAFGEAVLKALVDNEENEIVGVFLTQGRGGKEDPVLVTARELSLSGYECARFRDAEAISQFEALEAELCVMAYVIDIVPMEMINAPTRGTIQYHPSLLPHHRGPSSINWPIVNGETQTGLSIFWPDEGLDTGPLLIQKTVEINPDDTLGSLYFEKLFPMGVEAMVEAVELVRQGKAPKIVQNEDDATYEGWFKAKEARIDWSRPGSEVYNLIRGSDPQPGANSTLDGQTVSFYAASFAPGYTSESGGTVVGIGEQIEIAVNGGTITVGRVRGADGKVPAAAFVEATGLKPGDRFGG
jgi:methionyl-tRNA formyltransferase